MNSELNNKNKQEVNIIDVLLYFFSKWPWILLSLIVCCAFAWYRYASSPYEYYTSAKVIIKDPSNKTTSAGLDRYSNSINKVNVANEILQFRSKRLMQEVVTRTNANISYTTHRGLRDVDIYGETPFIVSFIKASPRLNASMVITPISRDSVELSEISGTRLGYKRVIRTGVPYRIDNVRFMVMPTGIYTPEWNGVKIKVDRRPVNSVVGFWLANLGIRQENEESTILNLAVKKAATPSSGPTSSPP